MAYASVATPFGVLTVFVELEAVVALEWGRVEPAEPGPGLDRAMAALEAYGSGDPEAAHIVDAVPVAPAGSAFQRRVWRHLRQIPWGATITYGALAAALGSAPRAVAGACARNPIPIIIPCHRVVGAGGILCGYSGGEGPSTKAALLAHEGAARAPTAAGAGRLTGDRTGDRTEDRTGDRPGDRIARGGHSS